MKDTVTSLRSVRLTENEWTTVLSGLGNAMEAFDLSGVDKNEFAAAQKVCAVHDKIAGALGRSTRMGELEVRE